MARIRLSDIEILSQRLGPLKVIIREGYEERFLSVNDVIKELLSLRGEDDEQGRILPSAEKKVEGLNSESGGKDSRL